MKSVSKLFGKPMGLSRPVSNPTRGSYRRVEPDPTILLGPVPYYLQTVNVKMQGNK